MTTRSIALREIATARTGDKGNRLNIALVCRDPSFYPEVARQITAERVAHLFALRKPGAVKRYDLPKLAAFNFVLDDVLEGGVNASLGLDGHGKALSFLVLTLELSVSAAIITHNKTNPIAGGNDEATSPYGRHCSVAAGPSF
jgi:hypothetical protein